MKRKLLITLLSVTVLAITSVAQDLGLDPKLKTGKLPNGLTYYIRENAKPEKKVELRLVVNVGSVMEDDDQQGLAHMAEHMAFNGTRNFKKNDLVSFLQSIGVEFGNDLNAYTGFDETVYILPIPTDKKGNIEKGFQILEDWAHQVTYLDEDINNERAIILEESRSRKSANDRMLKTILPELLKGSRYANRLPIGVDSIIAGFKPDVIRRFYRDWYRPDLMAVVVVGDIRQADAMALIEKHFAGLKNPASPRPRTFAEVPPYAASNAVVVTDKEATGFNFSLNYPAKPVQPSRTEAQYREDLVKNLYTSMLNARFRELTQKENPPFVFASAGFGGIARNYEGFSISAGTGTNNIRKGIDAAAEEIERVKRYGFTEAELQRAKKNLITSYENSYNNRDKTESGDFAQEYISHFTRQEPQPGIEWEYDYVRKAIPTVSLAEVNKVTDIYRNEKNRFAYIMGPEGQQTLPTTAEVLAAVDAKQSADIKPYEEKAVATTMMAREPKSGKVISTTRTKDLGTTELKLSNGITVTLKRTDFKSDQVLMGAYRWGGNGSYGVKDKITAENTVAVISSMGVGTFSPVDLRKAMAGKTANVSPFITDDSEGFRGTSSNRDIETMLQMMHLYVTEPRTDTALFRSYIQRNKAQYALIGANPQAAFIDTVYRVLFNDNPLAPTAVPKSENFDKIDLERAKSIYKERMGDMSGMHFTFVGSFREDSIVPLIEKYIASLPASGAKTNFTDNKVRPFRGNKNISVKKGKDDKSLIIAFLSGETPYSEQKSFGLQALSEVMNIKITEEMREKIQGIYSGGTFAEMSRTPYSSYQFALQLPCGPAKVDTLIKAFNAEMQGIADKGPGQAYVDKVRNQWIEQYRTNVKTNEYWLGRLQQIRQGNASAERLLNYEKYANALKPADIQAAAKMVIASPSRLVAVQMPAK